MSLLYFLLVLGIHGVHVAASSTKLSLTLPGCPDKCGNITVPFPLGIIDGCSRDVGLLLSCDKTSDPPRLLLNLPKEEYPLRVTDVSLDTLTVSYTKIAWECNPPTTNADVTSFALGDAPFTFSAAQNKLTTIGCDSLGLFSTAPDTYSGCFSACSNTSVIVNGTCSGEGCCQASFKKGTKMLTIVAGSSHKHLKTRNISNCTVAFPVRQDWYRFSYRDLASFPWTEVPVVLEWAIGSESCAVASRSTGFACMGSNSRCVDSESGQGYRCHCMDGYEGNPYLKDGCVDIDECKDPNADLCSDICINTPGNYTCICPEGTNGDGRKNGKGCIKSESKFPVAAQITLGVGLGIMVLVVCIALLYCLKKKGEYILLKQQYFEQNGGILLQQQMSAGEVSARIFSEEELKVATAGFNENRILGTGGNGTVYKGFLSDNTVVAIKKSKGVDQTQLDQFVNEFVLLSRVIHRNVVKILGCCLETEMPMLVYEYIPNGTLYDRIHCKRSTSLSWDQRLCTAADTAGAIAHLHSGLSRPIIHRDIKSANILLDESFTAKVADFGASKLAPKDEAELGTMVQGTLGYLDPEYMLTGNLTDRSDVFSFGVVLAELLTGQRSISFAKVDESRILATYFLMTLKEGRLSEILDPAVKQDGRGDTIDEQVVKVAEIAGRCLGMKAEERPSMKEVAAELDKLRGYGGPPMHPSMEPGDDHNPGKYENGFDGDKVRPLSIDVNNASLDGMSTGGWTF